MLTWQVVYWHGHPQTSPPNWSPTVGMNLSSALPCTRWSQCHIVNGACFLYEALNYLLYTQHSSLNKIFRHLIWRGRQTAICNISFVFFIKSGMTVVGAVRLRPQVCHSATAHLSTVSPHSKEVSHFLSIYVRQRNSSFISLSWMLPSVGLLLRPTGFIYLYLFYYWPFSYSCSWLLIEMSFQTCRQRNN